MKNTIPGPPPDTKTYPYISDNIHPLDGTRWNSEPGDNRCIAISPKVMLDPDGDYWTSKGSGQGIPRSLWGKHAQLRESLLESLTNPVAVDARFDQAECSDMVYNELDDDTKDALGEWDEYWRDRGVDTFQIDLEAHDVCRK